MESLERLNRRHKTALFLTLVAAGASVVLGADAKRTARIAVLGLAFAWAFGSNTRIVHWLLAGSGVALLTREAIRQVARKRQVSERTVYRTWGKYYPKKKKTSPALQTGKKA